MTTTTPERSYDRAPDQLRPVTIEPGFVRTATGSALISMGETRVICTASVQESVPRWLLGSGRGWVTAEYGMLPASTGDRKQRDITKGRADGRTIEIQRLIGRSLRGVVDFEALGERTIYVDCDVLQADGGTRCASITGGLVALRLACNALIAKGSLDRSPLTGTVAAVSSGIVGGVPLLDLDYSEDSTAEVDANVVMTGDGGLVEVQATAERTPLSRAHLDELLALAALGIERLRSAQDDAVAAASPRLASPMSAPMSRPRPDRPPLVLATRNRYKVDEVTRLLAPVGVDGRAAARRHQLPPEDGDTFADNALPKARAAAAATGRPSIADDSGIEAEALDGRPGVRSARYAGLGATDEENLLKLMHEAPVGSAPAVRVRARVRRSGERRGAGVLRRVPRTACRRAAGNPRVRLRPGVSARPRPGIHGRCRSSPRPRRMRSAIGATRCGRSRSGISAASATGGCVEQVLGGP